MNKVIFLDIDGVLATHKEFMMSSSRFMSKNTWAKKLFVPYPFNKGCVEVFNQILKDTNADIVLSSDWKDHWNIDELDLIFKSNGVINSPIFTTHSKKYKFSSNLEMDRYYQIMDWVNYNKPNSWVVIDDLNMTSLFEGSGNLCNFFLTKDSEGIKKTSLKNKIIQKLNELKV